MTKRRKTRRQKGELVAKALEILQGGIETSFALLEAFLPELRRSNFAPIKTDWSHLYRERQQFYSLLNKLKNQGLVEKQSGTDGSALWQITKEGEIKLNQLRKQKIFRNNSRGGKQKSERVKIIIFDVPETERKKRAWLRSILQLLNFTMLQKSVWIGRQKIPVELIKELKDNNLLDYVQIFEISKKGSIEKMFGR